MDVLVSGNTYKFRLTASKDGVLWDITGATVKIGFKLPDGTTLVKTATITNAVGGVAEYTSLTTDIATPGIWALSWEVTQGAITQEYIPTSFIVVAGII